MGEEEKEQPKFEEFEDLEVSRNSLTILITGILVIIAGFVTYNFFADRAAQNPKEQSDFPVEQLQKDLDKNQEKQGKTEAGSPEEITNPETGGVAGSSTEKDNKEEQLGYGGPEAGVETTSGWVANDLTPNSFIGENYQVKSGDTLWEIAEARYGSGFEWTKILEANSQTVDFLASGSQALIVPGQTLVLPN